MFCFVFGYLTEGCFPSSTIASDDVISALPPEVSTIILRLLPGKDLLNAATVCKRWLCLAKGDVRLRRKVRRHIRREMRITLAATLYGSRTYSYQDLKGIHAKNPRKYAFPGVPYNANFIVWKRMRVSAVVTNNDRPSLYYRTRI